MTEIVNAVTYKEMLGSGAALLERNRQQINELNVFPVPDGDTGTNMSLTLNAGVTALERGGNVTVTACADTAASALLRGARGNSGVILSLLFRGMSKHLKGKEEITALEFALALQEGVSTAYKAVMRPTEGTILTVSRRVADEAVLFAEDSSDFEAMLERMLVVGDVALSETTEQNPTLKKAGVVDAGAKGYLFILRGMLSALRGEPVARAEDDSVGSTSAFSVFSDSDITFTYDTVFIIRKTMNRSIKAFEAYLNSVGDSLVIGEDDEAFKVHVHTDVPGEVISEGQKYGTLELAKIENMRLQYQDAAAGRKTRSADDLDEDEEEPERRELGVVAVCAGEGMERVFKDLGVDAVVTGGQTMNPSAEDILRAIQSVPAGNVIVLPNNANIIMAAQQCCAMTVQRVSVIPTATMPQGISAMFCYDPESDIAELEKDMTDACRSVHTVFITYAARDSVYDGRNIQEGEYIALLENTLLASGRDLAELLSKVSDALNRFSPEVLTVFFGEDVTPQAAEAVKDKLSSDFPNADMTLVDGGQPVYYYMISAE